MRGVTHCLQNKQSDEWEDEPPEEVLLGGEEGLDGGAGSEEFGDRKDVEAKGHDEHCGTQGISEFFAEGFEFHFAEGIWHYAEAEYGSQEGKYQEDAELGD